jgi:glutathione synthase/RimK-type ligase-like ATP-grasp enzyme
MAIFSQSNEKTKIDFRNYDLQKPNRTVPYNLPKEIILKLKKLTKALALRTGSIDLIKAKDGQYYFLEVNPVGQFGMVSRPCNYNIEMKIAKFLCFK